MCGDTTEQLLEDVSNCVAFSLQLDESTDIRDIAQLLVFIRMVFEDFMLRRQHDDFPDFLSYHCIIHQQVLASKRLNTKTVMDITFKIVNSVRGRSLQRWLFNLTLDEGAVEIILHTDVRWLSRHKFLQRFRDLLNEIRSFLKERGDDQAELEDEEWLCDLAFLADFTGELSDMNLELQGKNKCIGEMMSTVSSYKSKLELMMTDLANNTFDHFPNTQDHLGQYPNFVFQNEKYVTEICSVIQEFENRFCDFPKIGTVVEYLSYPFKVDVDIKETAAAISKNYSLNKPSLENEILTLKNNIFLKTRAEQELNRFGS